MTARHIVALVAVCAVLLLQGCPIPIPGTPLNQRETVDEGAVERLRLGTSTREDVLLALGEPTLVAEDNSWFDYSATRNLGHWAFVACGGYQCGELFETKDRHRCSHVVAFFDEDGRLLRLSKAYGRCDRVADGPCFEVTSRWRPEATVGSARFPMEFGEVPRATFVAAARRTGDTWVAGTAVVTNRAVLFMADGDAGAAKDPVRMADVQSAGWKTNEASRTDLAIVQVTRADRAVEAWGFGGKGLAEGSTFDREQAQRFIDAMGPVMRCAVLRARSPRRRGPRCRPTSRCRASRA